MGVPRIHPLDPPYEAEADHALRRMMPAGMDPILLFRTLGRNLPMARAMHGWGRYLLGPAFSAGLRHREVVIDRTCARCGCDYEWGVHVAFFSARAGLSAPQVRSLAQGDGADPCWGSEDRLLVRLVDALHDDGDVDDELWSALAAVFSAPQLLDLVALCGWYHAVCFVARAARVALEPGAPTLRPG